MEHYRNDWYHCYIMRMFLRLHYRKSLQIRLQKPLQFQRKKGK